MSYEVDFVDVSTVGLESSPVVDALAGLRANEARYFKNKYDHVFTVEPASKAKKAVEWVHRILKEDRDIVISSRPLDQRPLSPRRPGEASGRLQALRGHGDPRRAEQLQVRPPEVEAGRDDPGLVLRDQRRVLTRWASNPRLFGHVSRMRREVYPGHGFPGDALTAGSAP